MQAQFSHPRKHLVVSQRLVALVAALLLLAAIVAGSALADESESETYGSPEITRAAVEEAARSSSIEQQLTDVGLAEELPHADLGREEAIELDNGVFEGELESPAGVFDELEPSAFYSDYAAVIPAGSAPEPASVVVGGEAADQYDGPTLLESTIPLATRGESGEREVINLSLADEEGALKPANPLVETALPENLADGMTLGPSGLKISIVGAPADRSPSVVDGSVGFYPNVATDTDLAVAPTPTGLETFSSLRTEDAPREITYALTLPTGSRLQQTAGEGAAVISASGETEVSIAKPVALDAAGAEVPVEMEVNGSDLHLRVKAGEEPALPILVDPLFQYEEFKWYEQNTAAGTSNFKVDSTAPALKTGTIWSSEMPNPGISLNSPGLYVQAPRFAKMAPGTGAVWAYAVPRLEADEKLFGAPPTSFIASMDLHDLGFFKEWTSNGYPLTSPGEDPRYWSGIWDSYDNKWAVSWSHGGEEGSITNFGITYHYPGNNDHNAKLAEPVGLWAANETYMGFGPREAYVGYVGISLGDEDKPHFASVSSPEWNDGSKSVVPISFTATDTGLGVRSISVTDPVNLPPKNSHQSASLSCWSQANPCPRTWNSKSPGMPQAGYEPAKLPSGITKLILKAHDPVGNTSTATVLAKVDRTAPEVVLAGGLTESGPKVRPKDYSLLVTAKDGGESAPQSGVGSVEIKIDGTQVKDVGCEKQSCEMTPEWVLHTDAYSLGAHNVEVAVTDRVGHVSKREIKFSIEKDTTPPEITHLAHFTQISYGPSIWAEEVAAKDPLSGVARTELFVDGRHVEAAVNSCAEAEDEEEGHCFAGAGADWHAFLVNMAELSPGTHTMEAVVTDGAGNVARRQAPLNVEAGVGASKVAPSLTLAGTMTEQASLGTTRPRYILKTEAGAGSESEGWTPVFQSAFGTSGSGPGQLNGPRGIATDGSGHVWVVDRANNRVEEYGEGGEYISQFGSAGSGNGQFKEPWGIAVTRAGNIWVTDTGNQRVEEFNGKGEFIQKFGTKAGSGGSKGTEFMAPEGIASGPGGMLWVSDGAGHRVSEFRESVSSESERFVRNVTGATLVEPMSVALDASGDAWVADEEANRVFEFGPEGAYLQTVGTTGSGNGQLSGPTGVAVAPSGDIYVVDRNNNRVQVFHPNGTFVTKFGTAGTGNGNFSEPRAIALGAGNVIFVTDKGNNRVHKWTQAASPPGVARTEITVDGNAVGTSPTACLTGSCTQAREWLLNASESSVGSHSVVVRATTEAGITTTKTLSFEIQKDTTKPSLTVGGELPNAPDGWVEQHRYGLNATATDSNGSGIKSLVLKVDGVPAESVSKSCLEGGCKAALTLPVNTADYSGGAHTAEVVATDGTGNLVSKRWTLNVDPQGYVGFGEEAETLEAVEETAEVNVVGPSEEEVENEIPGIAMTEGPYGVEATGTATPVVISTEGEQEPCTVMMDAAPTEEALEEAAGEEEVLLSETGVEREQALEAAAANGGIVKYVPEGEPLTIEEEAQSGGNCETAIVNGNAAVDTNVESEVDSVTRPLFDGSLNFKAIRGEDAPESYSWTVELEKEQHLVLLDSHHAAVEYADGTPAVSVTAEPAHDATGAEVPTKLSVSDGDVITLTVEFHKPVGSSPYVFPVLAGAGYEVGTEEVTVVYPPEPTEEEEQQLEEAGENVSEIAAGIFHYSRAAWGPPVFQQENSDNVPTRSRAYRFNACSQYIKGTKPEPPGPPRLEYSENGSSRQCHAEGPNYGEIQINWAVVIDGRFYYRWHHKVWVEQAPKCNQWGPHKPTQRGCYVRHQKREAYFPDKVEVLGDWRFIPGAYGGGTWGGGQEACVEIVGVLPSNPKRSENGEPVYFENMHEVVQPNGYEESIACPWEHLN